MASPQKPQRGACMLGASSNLVCLRHSVSNTWTWTGLMPNSLGDTNPWFNYPWQCVMGLNELRSLMSYILGFGSITWRAWAPSRLTLVDAENQLPAQGLQCKWQNSIRWPAEYAPRWGDDTWYFPGPKSLERKNCRDDFKNVGIMWVPCHFLCRSFPFLGTRTILAFMLFT